MSIAESTSNRRPMFKNFFRTAWRHIKRNKIYSLINIAGLSTGLAAAMLIMLYVKDEVSFDKFHKNVNNIYRVVTESNYRGQTSKDGNTGSLAGPRFAQNVPGIQKFVRIKTGSHDIKIGNDVRSQDLLFVDSNFFSVFSFPLIKGDAGSCLKEPNSIVLSEDAALKQLGTTDAVGKIVMLREDSAFVPYKVTAVTKRCPQNSSIRFEVLLPFKESKAVAENTENWFSFFLNTFVVLNPNADVQMVQRQMQKFYVADAKEAFKKLTEKYGDIGSLSIYLLQPYTDMHLSTELPAQNGLTGASNPVYSYILSGIALFILLIASINFVNLTIARSVKRAKEIGIRKVVGSNKNQLIMQFLGEAFLICAIAFTFAVLLVFLILPLFNNLSNKALALSYLFDAKLVASYISLFFITGFLAGFYPALVLSGYNPVKTLYSRFNLFGKNYLQKSLVVLQFALASFLIIATFIIYTQFNFLTHYNLGYDDSNVVIVNKDNMEHREAALFKSELLKDPHIIDVAPKSGGYSQTIAKLDTDSTINFAYETVDESFLPLYKIPLVQGRNFSAEFPADSYNSVIVNETFVKRAGWKNPIGETVNFWHSNTVFRVIGVIKDYHFASLNRKIIPQLFTMKHDNLFGTFNIRIKPNTNTASLSKIEATFRQLFPLSPFSYSFKDQENYKNYEDIEKWKQVLLFGAILTIFISCIGLFGLTVLSAEKRTKEIGIRKVLGASVNSIIRVLTRDFMILVTLALIIAAPLAYVAGNTWLENYPYRITQSWMLFAGAGLLVVMIALITVSLQAVKAAMANPVKSLRTE